MAIIPRYIQTFIFPVSVFQGCTMSQTNHDYFLQDFLESSK